MVLTIVAYNFRCSSILGKMKALLMDTPLMRDLSQLQGYKWNLCKNFLKSLESEGVQITTH